MGHRPRVGRVVDFDSIMETGLAELSARHLAACAATGVAPGTMRLYRRVERDYQAFVASDDRSALNVASARAWLLALRARGTLKETSIRLYVACLKVWAGWLEQEDEFEVSPLRKLKLPRVRPPVIEIFSPSQVQALLTAAERGLNPERDSAILYTLLDTMVRASELCSLRIPAGLQSGSAVEQRSARRAHNPEVEGPNPSGATANGLADSRQAARVEGQQERSLPVNGMSGASVPDGVAQRPVPLPVEQDYAGSSPVSVASGSWLTVVGKGSKERRVRYGPETAAVLARYLATRTDREPWLFVGAHGGQLKAAQLAKLITTLGYQAGIRGVRCSPHTFRHCGAVRWLQAHPGSVLQLQQLLGHETLTMTQRYSMRAQQEYGLGDGPSGLSLAIGEG
jgi:site-specific recombinase XerD